MQPGDPRARAIDAVDVLNDFMGDFVIGVRVFQEYAVRLRHKQIQLGQMVAVQKMCLSNIALAFAKFEEFWQHYHDIVPVAHRGACKQIVKEIRDRKITEFRNHCVGHIWNKQKGRPVVQSEAMAALDVMVKGDFHAFLHWINDPPANTYPATVISVIETVRDSIASEFGITPDEAIDR